MKQRTFVAVALVAALAFAAPVRAERESPPQRITFEEMMRRADRAEIAPLGRQHVVSATPASPLAWESIGPQPIHNEYWSGAQNASGRISSIAIDPTNADVVYISGAQGGVWKTVDGGTNWQPLTDHLSSLASGSVTLDPVRPDTVYYGTGEHHYCGDCYPGDGLFRSTDAGATWSKIAGTASVGSYISRVRVHPSNSNIVYLSGTSGVMRSTDYGATWQQRLSQNCDDIAVDPTNGARIFAALNGIGIYRSTDTGTSWTFLFAAPVSFGRVNIAQSRSNPQVLYAGFITGGDVEVYRTTDGGTSWTNLSTAPNYVGGQGWYDHCMVVDPTNPDILIAGGMYPYDAGLAGIVRTADGGATWTDITLGHNGVKAHPDQHYLEFGPDGNLWVANDGGLWRSTDQGWTWINKNRDLVLTQFYTVDSHPTVATTIHGGTQDNGTLSYAGLPRWFQLVSGDGGPVAFEWDSPNISYATYVYLNPTWRLDIGSIAATLSAPYYGEGADWCNSPIRIDPNQPNTLLVGAASVWRSTDSGNSWTALGPQLGYVLRSLDVAHGNSSLIYAGLSSGALWVTANASTWNARSSGLPFGAITDIYVDPANGGHAYISVDVSSGHRVFTTADTGRTWTGITPGLPVPLRGMSLEVDWRTPTPRLFLGTDFGVYESTNNGATWLRSGEGFPNVAIYDLDMNPNTGYVVAATHGRGMWRALIDLAGPSVVVGNPNGGEDWYQGSRRYITWSANDVSGVDSVRILLSSDGGASFPMVLASGLPNSGQWTWDVNGPVSAASRIRVEGWDSLENLAGDMSNANFTVSTPLAAGDPIVAGVDLLPPAPNPARHSVQMTLDLPRRADVGIEVYDLQGRHVRTLARGARGEGRHEIGWDLRDATGRPVGAGLYLVAMRSADVEKTHRVLVAR